MSQKKSLPGFPRRPAVNGGFGGLPPYVWVGLGGTTALILTTYYAFLDEVPLTKRKRWMATSLEWEQRLGDAEYKKLLSVHRGDILPANHRAAVTVKRVGERLATAASEVLANKELRLQQREERKENNNIASAIKNKPYTYTVIRSDTANAFVLPGNHVFVMTGLLRYMQDEDDLAAVLGHETAHNVARHAGEKMSAHVAINIVARLSLLFDPTGMLFTWLIPAASLFRELPNSRQQEIEADQIGLLLSAQACFDPRAAPRFFRKLQQENDDKRRANVVFLSTHPSHDRRIGRLEESMPKALTIFQQDRCASLRQAMKEARQAAAFQALTRERQHNHHHRASHNNTSPSSERDW